MKSREAILKALRENAPIEAALPPPSEGIRYADLAAQFLEMVSEVGGAGLRVPSAAAIGAELSKLPFWAQTTKTVVRVAGAGRSTMNVDSIVDPHELEGLEVAVLPGEIGVAENGAVWVPGQNLGPHRAVFVIAEHLVLVVPAEGIVSNMHDAYARIELERPGYGVFISGPSKTADIEQALVMGAHGARSCTVFVVG